MTLLVADDSRRSLRDVLGSDVVAVDAEAVSDAVARDDPDVVVVDAGAVADPAGVVQEVRSNARDTAVVAVGTTGTDADVTCAATDEASIRAAVDRARRVADYRRSVADLYAACRDRALGQPDADLRDSRRDADAKFADLPGDREAFAAALRTEADRRGNDADEAVDDAGAAAPSAADARDEAEVDAEVDADDDAEGDDG
ncbi:hypothetical protein [Halobacterium bonnevillei]|uniref:Uncharacterized protein n=1 Tax=Halobacterium bonnevillei TaxID=2692200 RepID=A0A6B0SGJ6_9EURY|nr:hypothetical protein [Halobacterium bonnevillei]MXR19736.1 hypothetical protein [Halobacterium bonnevillei]